MRQLITVECLESRCLLSGGLDPTFGTNGLISGGVNYLPGGVPVTVMVRSDKGIVVAANYAIGDDPSKTGEALVGLLQDGSLDPKFGVNGVEDIGRSVMKVLSGAVMQPDGKVVVVGDNGNDSSAPQIILERFNQDGTPDSSFANNSMAAVDLPSGFFPQISNAENVALAPDGKIIIADAANRDDDTAVGITRLTSNGQLDSTFATGGRLSIDNTPATLGSITGVAVDRRGRIVVGGDDGLIRVTSSGALDASFGTDGQVAFPESETISTVTAIALCPDGNIVAVGTAFPNDTYAIFATQYTASGKQDLTFGKRGFRIFMFPDRSAANSANGSSTVFTTTVDAKNRIVVAGSSGQSNVGGDDIGIARLTSAGALDRSFGRNGLEAIGGGNVWPAMYISADAIHINPDGSIIVAGSSSNGYDTDDGRGMILLREHPSGALDPSFGYHARAGIFPAIPQTQITLVQPDGKILLAGPYATARLTTSGTPDPSFGAMGMNLSSQDEVDDVRTGRFHNLAAVAVTSSSRIVELISVQKISLDDTDDLDRTTLPFEIRSYSANGTGSGAISGLAAARQLSHRFAGLVVLSAIIQRDDSAVILGVDDNRESIVARITSSGALDASFGTRGAAVVNPPGISNFAYTTRIYSDAAGGVVLVGSGSPSDASSSATYPVFAIRLDKDGNLDPNFGGTLYSPTVGVGGETPLPPNTQAPDGSIYLVKSGLIMLHLVSGAPDTSLSADGTFTLAAPASSRRTEELTFGVVANRIFVVLYNSSGNEVLTAYHTDGALDTTFANNGVLTLPTGLSPQYVGGTNQMLILSDPLDSTVSRIDIAS